MDRDFEVKCEKTNSESINGTIPFTKKSSSNKAPAKIWAVASGKGGVGKTLVSTSLAITLSKLGHSVVIIDLDFTGANVHTSFGLHPSELNIRHFFEGTKKLKDIISNTQLPRVSFIQGYWDSWAPTNITVEQVDQLIPQLRKLRADYVIVDLGSGALEAHLHLLSFADEKFLITSPEVTSIEKTYRFIEAYVCQTLRGNSTPEAYDKLLATLRKYRQRKIDKHFSFRTYMKSHAGLSIDVLEILSNKPMRLIVNSSRSKSDEELGYSIKMVCNKYYDLSLDYLCSIDYDNAAWQSLRERKHVLISQPFTTLTGQFLSTCKQLIATEELRAVI